MSFTPLFLLAINSLQFLLSNHPLSMLLYTIFQTILICFMIGLLTSTLWYAYMLFMAFMGGMLVLFAYITALAFNEKFDSMFLLFLPLVLILLFLSFMPDMIFFNSFNTNIDSNLMTHSYSLSLDYETLPSLIKLYNHPTFYLTIFLINYLFLTLIIIVNITNISEGPLRHKS